MIFYFLFSIFHLSFSIIFHLSFAIFQLSFVIYLSLFVIFHRQRAPMTNDKWKIMENDKWKIEILDPPSSYSRSSVRQGKGEQ